jgi:molybdopterin/thiamine biosynthesis adenylyltransferase
MAGGAKVIAASRSATLRIAEPEAGRLFELVFSRYPNLEWGSFARFGWRSVGERLVVTLAGIDQPMPGDMDERVPNVRFREQYSLRVALDAERHRLAIGVIHSHPRHAIPRPSDIDDDMDRYFADYFSGFTGDRPYVSLIASQLNGEIAVSGRIYFDGLWYEVDQVLSLDSMVRPWPTQRQLHARPQGTGRAARLVSSYGEEAYRRLRAATVAVVGAGGTGSAAIPVLARAGVGRIVAIDPDHITESNLERVHGAYPSHVRRQSLKVSIAQELVGKIDSTVSFTGLVGRVPQPEVVDAIVQADVVLGCTDQHSSRLAISELAYRYLVPTIDTAVTLEGRDGRVTGQIGQLVRMLPRDRCAICRGLIRTDLASFELMSDDEKAARRAAAEAAEAAGEDPNPYWKTVPQINTVGSVTTTIGALAANYAIGWISGRYTPPFSRLQLNLIDPSLGVDDYDPCRTGDCTCQRVRGWADQGAAEALISPPTHWPAVRELGQLKTFSIFDPSTWFRRRTH